MNLNFFNSQNSHTAPFNNRDSNNPLNCNILYNNYIPSGFFYRSIIQNKVENWNYSIVKEAEYRHYACPNSIKKVVEFLTIAYRTAIFKTSDESVNYLIGDYSIFKREGQENSVPSKISPCFLLVYPIEKILTLPNVFSTGSNISFNLGVGNETAQVFKDSKLLIDSSFIEGDDTKSLYRRLNKEFIPALQEKGVEVMVTTSEYIKENTLNTSNLFIKSPEEKDRFVEQMLEDKFEVTLPQEATDIDLPF